MTNMKEAMERYQERWETKVIRHCRGNQTKMGCIIIAIIGRMPQNPPRIGRTGCAILANGQIIADYQAQACAHFLATPICTVKELVDGLRRLCDQLKLGDADRIAMFDLARKWIVKDYRATSNLDDWKPPKGQY